MPYPLNKLGDVFMNQLADIVIGGDDSAPPPKNAFFTWAQPGIPFNPSTFDFASTGLGAGKDATEDKVALNHAFTFAELVNFIPDIAGAYTSDKQEGRFRPDAEARLSTIYGEILRFSKVVHTDLTDDEKAKIEKFRKLLRVTRTVKDLVTDEEKEVTEDSPMMQAYYDKQGKYLAAALQYNNKRVAAQSATGAEGKAAVADWSSNADLYRLQVKSARDAWVSGGYRNEVDEINAWIDQVSRRDLVLWKQTLVELFEDAVVNGVTQGQRFYYTTVLPGDFATAGGWTDYSVSHETVDARTHDETTTWNAKAGVNFGFWHAEAGVTSESAEHTESLNIDKFAMSFELCQTAISRPWFYPEFFQNRGWTLRTGEGWMYDDMPSNGAAPPATAGKFIGYPTQIIWARNVRIRSEAFVRAFEAHASKFSASGTIGWGPLTLGGAYSHTESSSHLHIDDDRQALSVDGMQIIGFVNHLIGKAPDPLEGLDHDRFV